MTGPERGAVRPAPSLEELRAYRRNGRARVRTDGEDRPVAYPLADVVDGCARLEQVTVHPDHALADPSGAHSARQDGLR